MKHSTHLQNNPRRKAKPSQQGHAWLLHHLYVLFSSLGRIARTPLPSLMTAAVIGIALALPTGLYLLLENVQQISNDWESVAQMSLFIKPEINDDAKINAFAKKLEQHPDIHGIRIITPAQALEEYRQLSGFGDALKALEENPLPAVIVIQPASSEVEANQRLLKNLEQLPEVDIVQFDMLWLKRLFTIITIIRRGVLILAGLLSLAVLLVIGNTIRLAIYNRRDEIEIYKLVGATDTFIRRPFLYIGFWYGLFGGLIAWVLVNISLWLLKKPVKQLAILYESQFELVTLDALSSFILLFCGALLGLAGAWLAVGQHLKNIQPR
ncbi:MAG: cell division protein FtsX [Gammaproteobacteria bacterium]|nr:MAG: cell division protein FtsX [Gammaproteobacteria bacterium]RKZ76327.1 MAG: cell division protein FtsX [Gammaproteobacteria bacterium]